MSLSLTNCRKAASMVGRSRPDQDRSPQRKELRGENYSFKNKLAKKGQNDATRSPKAKRQRQRSDLEIAKKTAIWLESRERVVLPSDNKASSAPCNPARGPSFDHSTHVPADDHTPIVIDVDSLDLRPRAQIEAVRQLGYTKLMATLEEENQKLRVEKSTLTDALDKEKGANCALLTQLHVLRGKLENTSEELDALKQLKMQGARSEAGSRPRISDTPWKQLDYRTRGKYRSQVVSILRPLASRKDGSISEEDLRSMLSEIWTAICPNSSLLPSLTPSEDLQIMKICGLTWEDREELQRYLTGLGCNILSPYNQVWNLNKEHIAAATIYYENGETPLMHTAKDGEHLVGPSGFCRVKRTQLQQLIVDECVRHERGGIMNYSGRFDGEVWLAYMSDKGADSTKAGIAIMNTMRANSPFFVIPIASWFGEECYDNQMEVIGSLMKDLGKITKITVGNVERRVILHGVADFCARNVLLGQKSTSHSNPCTECEYEKSGGAAPVGTRVRTEERRKECLEEYRRLLDEGVKEEEAARASKGVVREPIVPIRPSDFCVASVHLATGPGARALSLIESNAISLDLVNAGSTIQLQEMKDRKDLEGQFQNFIDSTAAAAKVASLEVEDCDRLIAGLSLATRTSGSECAAAYCPISNLEKGKGKLRRRIAWTTDTCSVCKKGFHFACSLTLSAECEQKSKMTCPSCLRWSKDRYLVEVRAKLVELKNKLLERQKNARLAVSDNRRLIEIVRGKGAMFSQVKLFLASKGVSRSNWFQAYSGREVREALKDRNITILFDMIGLEKKGTLWEALTSIRDILALAKPQFLSPSEMENLKSAVSLFSSSYRTLFPNADLAVKVHYISSHLLTYATLYETIGLVSEQSIEHFHALFNRYLRQFRSLSSPGKKLQRIMCEHLIVSRLVSIRWTQDDRKTYGSREEETRKDRRGDDSESRRERRVVKREESERRDVYMGRGRNDAQSRFDGRGRANQSQWNRMGFGGNRRGSQVHAQWDRRGINRNRPNVSLPSRRELGSQVSQLEGSSIRPPHPFAPLLTPHTIQYQRFPDAYAFPMVYPLPLPSLPFFSPSFHPYTPQVIPSPHYPNFPF